MSWQVVYEIAGGRHGTLQGKKPLTEHAYEVLEAFAQNEAQERILRSVGLLAERPF